MRMSGARRSSATVCARGCVLPGETPGLALKHWSETFRQMTFRVGAGEEEIWADAAGVPAVLVPGAAAAALVAGRPAGAVAGSAAAVADSAPSAMTRPGEIFNPCTLRGAAATDACARCRWHGAGRLFNGRGTRQRAPGGAHPRRRSAVPGAEAAGAEPGATPRAIRKVTELC